MFVGIFSVEQGFVCLDLFVDIWLEVVLVMFDLVVLLMEVLIEIYLCIYVLILYYKMCGKYCSVVYVFDVVVGVMVVGVLWGLQKQFEDLLVMQVLFFVVFRLFDECF